MNDAMKILLELVEKKYDYHKKEDHGYRYTLTPYLEWIVDEIQEVEDEIKIDNSVYLEDELGDILWNYLNILFVLQKEGKIASIESVFQRAKNKYEERTDVIDISNIEEAKFIRDNIKKKQKEELNREHQERYW